MAHLGAMLRIVRKDEFRSSLHPSPMRRELATVRIDSVVAADERAIVNWDAPSLAL
jgi:hypothetical protein